MDLSWLTNEAKNLHLIFEHVFYSLALAFLVLGVVLEYFKIPLGAMPDFQSLVGRLLIAAILMSTYTEISNVIADFTDAVVSQIGSMNSFKLVLSQYYEKSKHLNFSWTSLRDSVLMLISFCTFFLLYISVYLSDAAITYVWVILYVFSPILISLYILPATSGATKALYRSLFEVSAWKIVWSVLATLLWSTALGSINQSQNNVNFITAIALNLILAASLLITPMIVHALAGSGIAGLAANATGMAAGAAMLSPWSLMNRKAKNPFSSKNKNEANEVSESSANLVGKGAQARSQKNFPVNNPSTAKATSKSGVQSTQKNSSNQKGNSPPTSSSPSNGAASAKTSSLGSAPKNSNHQVSFDQAVSSYKPPKNNSSIRELKRNGPPSMSQTPKIKSNRTEWR